MLAKAIHGTRPITLVGFSMAARAMYMCILELSTMGLFGVVDSVYLIGAPVSVDRDEWKAVRRVVSGRFVNVYSESDWLLGFLCRGFVASHVAGLGPVDGVENICVSDLVKGHLRYKDALADILDRIGFERDVSL